jgi:hypothetical protein
VFAHDHLANSRITFYPDFLIGTALGPANGSRMSWLTWTD